MDTDITKPSQQPFSSGPTQDSPDQEPSISPSEPSLEPTPPVSNFNVQQEKTKKGPSNILTILLAIIAVLGIGFGVYGMFFQPNAAETDCKTAEVDKTNKTEDKKTEENRGSSDSYHFYFGELGVKIEVPEEYKGKISYLYRNNGTVLVWGYKGESAPDYVNPLKDGSYPLFAITNSFDAFSDEKYSYGAGEEIFALENGNKLYYHPVDYSASPSATELQELASTLKLFFVDTYKYSKF